MSARVLALLALLPACVPDPLPALHDPDHDFDRDGFSEAEGDCDDADAATYPDADERCDGVDNDCNGAVDDDAVDAVAWYSDGDGDGYGADVSALSCDDVPGLVSRGGDCHDGRSDIHPAALEVCDGDDNDCDDLVDDEDPEVVGDTWYFQDADGDGYGNPDGGVLRCEQPSGYVLEDTDCHDGDDATHPGAFEVCDDDVDQDCDGQLEGCRWEDDPYLTTDADVTFALLSSADGEPVAIGPDMDGDGTPEVAIGNRDNAEAYLYDIVPGSPPTAVLLTTFDMRDAFAGGHLLAPGDLTGTGEPTLVISETKGYSSGHVFIAHGDFDENVGVQQGWEGIVYLEGHRDLETGAALAHGDFDGDTQVDLVIGAPHVYGEEKTGQVYVLHGPIATDAVIVDAADTVIEVTDDVPRSFGAALAGADLDGDGLTDLAVAQWGDHVDHTENAALLRFDAPFAASLDAIDDADALLHAPYDATWHPPFLAHEDFDGDGYPDVLFGIQEGAWLMFGGAAWPTDGDLAYNALGDADVAFGSPGSNTGMSVGAAGDLDTDGYGDILIFGDDMGVIQGRCYLIYGAPRGSVEGYWDLEAGELDPVEFHGAGDYARFGVSPGLGADFDGDGYGDLLFTDYGDGDIGSRAYLFASTAR